MVKTFCRDPVCFLFCRHWNCWEEFSRKTQIQYLGNYGEQVADIRNFHFKTFKVLMEFVLLRYPFWRKRHSCLIGFPDIKVSSANSLVSANRCQNGYRNFESSGLYS